MLPSKKDYTFGGNMPEEQSCTETEINTPSQIKAFANDLNELNRVVEMQQRSILDLAVSSLKATIDLVKDANTILSKEPEKKPQGNIDKAVKEFSDKLTATINSHELPLPVEADADSSKDIKQALILACDNVVQQQNQLFTLGEATLNQGINTMYAVVTASLAKVEEEKLMPA